MKLLITLELALLFLATTFQSHNPPGWYQVQLPVSNRINDIHFLDSLNGYVITERSEGSAHILHTTNGGNDWEIQFSQNYLLTSIEFTDLMTGYVVGSVPPGIVLKTTNGGTNWFTAATTNFYPIWDVEFVNRDTGWVCSDDEFDGGIFRTTNGGTSWQRQTLPSQLRPLKLFFLNRDTGLALASGKVYRTVNGGVNWSFVNTVTGLESDIFFLDYNTGWIIKIGAEGQGITKTTNAGSNWFVQRDPVSGGGGSGPICIFSLSESKAWIGCGFSTILSLVNDSTWGIQPAPFQSGGFFSINMVNSNIGYSGGLMFIKTTDGGGPITGITHESVSEINGLELYQNFPNPFNSGTSIKFSIDQRSDVRIDIYDVRGIAVSRIADGEYNEGSYDIRFDASGLASGIYYCVITARTQKESFAKSITMVLTK